MKRILVINPGSTSTKIAYYEDEICIWKESIGIDENKRKDYPTIWSQLDMRYEMIMSNLTTHHTDPEKLDCVVSRGGLIGQVSSGAIAIDDRVLDVLKNRPVNHHASNLGAAIAYKIASPYGIPSYIYDPVTVDEMIDIVRITGLKEASRFGQGHNLNMRAAAQKYCKDNGIDYYRANVIVAHLGGGITLSLQSNGRIIDMMSDDDGPFSPERAGEIPTFKLVKIIFDNNMDRNSTMKMLQRQGGLMSHMGTSDVLKVEDLAKSGDAHAILILDAMALSIARSIAKLSVVVSGNVDAIILTGGIAYSAYITQLIKDRVSFIANVHIVPGENEMEALAKGALRVLNNEEEVNVFVEKN